MTRPLIKICGITNVADARRAVACGADFLGFILARKSPRFVTAAQVRGIVADLDCEVRKVGVFVDSPADEIAGTLDSCGLDIAQLCGNESAAVAARVGVERVWKAFHITGDTDIPAALAFPASAILADTMLPGQRGGTGMVCNWDLAARVAGKRRLVLAGGIKPENLAEAVRTVCPYAVDIGSGVEAEPGRKDHEKLARLFDALKNLAMS